MDGYDLQEELEEFRKNVRCINCLYYPQYPGTLVAYEECRITGQLKRFDDFCENWSNYEWNLPEIEPKKETAMSIERSIKNLLHEEFKKLEAFGVMVSYTGPLRITHRDRNFLGFTIKHCPQSNSFNVYLNLGPTTSGAIYSIRSEEDAKTFVQFYMLGLSLKAKRKG